MDYHQQNGDDDYSILTFNQPLNSMSLTSSNISILDLTTKTNSLMMSKQSNININHLKNHTRSLNKRNYPHKNQIENQISSHLQMMTSTILPTPTITTTVTEKQEESSVKLNKIRRQEARPLGTCVRKCVQCRQLKHILLAECTVCFRMMDIDLKDCKCQCLTNENLIDHFICSICNSELTLDGYIICANRTCQTTLSALVDKEINNDIQVKTLISATLTNISYLKSTHRTVALQVNTLINLPPLERFVPMIGDDENRETSSSSSKRDLNETIITLTDSSDTSNMNIDNGIDVTCNNIVQNITIGFNSNQPTKLALQSDDEIHQQEQLQISNVCI